MPFARVIGRIGYAREMDLVRDILIWIENGAKHAEQPSKDDEHRFNYHCQIMEQAGLIKASIFTFPDDNGIDVPMRGRYRPHLEWA